MVEYRYMAIEPKAGTTIFELPLFGTFMDKRLNGAGNFTGFYRLNSHSYIDKHLLNYSAPGRYALAVLRNDAPVWAGMIWSRTWDPTTKNIQITGQTFESIFAHIPIATDFGSSGQIGQNHNTAWSTMLTNMQAQRSGVDNFNITYAGVGVSAPLISLNIYANEYRVYEDLIKILTSYEEGLNYTINLTRSGDTISKTLKTMFNQTDTASGMHFDYPGTISRYWYSENGARAALIHHARATDVSSYTTVPVATFTDTAGINAGYPSWTNIYNLPDIPNVSELQTAANKKGDEFKMPVVSPTFELGASSYFKGWDSIGQTLKMSLIDERFPTGKEIVSRLDGWSLTPGRGASEEIIRLVLKGDTT